MSKVISYSIEEILKFKNVNINILTEELSNIFDGINNLFLKSTQYLENRKKINYNQINSVKWKKINSNINTKLLSLLNKITEETFSNILEKILNSNIINQSQIEKLAEDLLFKILVDNDNNKLYCLMIKQIIDSGLWYFKDEINEYINFRIYFIKKIQNEYEECLNKLDTLKEKYFSDEDEYFSIKNRFTAIINTVINLHLNNILSDEIMNYVIDSLKIKYSNNIQDVIEYLCKINTVHNYEDVEIFLNNAKNNDKLGSRYKHLIEELNNKPIQKVIKVDQITEYKKFLTDGNLDSLKKHLGGKIDYLDLLKYVLDKLISININDNEKYINMIKKIKDRMKKFEYEKYMNENFDDLIEELPILSKYKSILI
jgi:hypothetical protein